MKASKIPLIRLKTQQLQASNFQSVKDLVGWMTAMQAQDYPMVKWAIGQRIPNSNILQINDAINRYEIIRTHLLRPTWHFVAADDLQWILQLNAEKIKSSLKHRHRELGITQSDLKKSFEILKKILQSKSMLRAEILTEFEKVNISTKNNRASHILMYAEQEGIICSGAEINTKVSYALIADKIKSNKVYQREEALSILARRYFMSHSPACIEDFIWWSNLNRSEAKKAIEMISNEFIQEKIEDQIYYIHPEIDLNAIQEDSVHLLAAFDEYIISYKNRNAIFTSSFQPQAVTNNGIFKAVLLINGKVQGIWKRSIKTGSVLIEVSCFDKEFLKKKWKAPIVAAAEAYAAFINKKLLINLQ